MPYEKILMRAVGVSYSPSIKTYESARGCKGAAAAPKMTFDEWVDLVETADRCNCGVD